MQNYIDKKILITAANWFYAPDGGQYKAVWGTLKGIHEAGKTLGFIPNRSHANWFFEIGSMVIMGCQIMYVIQCDEQPTTDSVTDWIAPQTQVANEVASAFEYTRPGAIYITK